MRNGRPRDLVIVMVGPLALVATGCATDGADASVTTAVADAPVVTAFATLPPPPTTAPPRTVPPTTVPTTDAETNDTATTDVSTNDDPSTTAGAGPEPSSAPDPEPDAFDGGIDVESESSADEPSFDIGPPVALDVDLVRFPVDDAGLGGVELTPTDGASDASAIDGDDDQSEAPPLSGWAAVDQSLHDALIRPGNTAASYAVSIDGDVVHAAAFGTRDPATGDPAEPHDRFRIASISKPITAIAALTLVGNGELGLDEPIGRRLADHVGVDSISAGAEQLTLRRLLSHRTGYGKFQSTFFGNGADDCADAARRGLSSGGGGGGYVYSNMNYCLAGLLVEAVTGESYERAVYRLLLTPLGIAGMRLPPTVDPGPDEVQHRTTPGRNYMETLGGAGSWIATPTQLVTILDSLDLSTSGYKPLDLESVFAMVVPPGANYGQRGYGLGLISYGDGRFGHTGTIESTHAMVLNRGDGVTWAITVAGDHPGESTDLERIMNRAFEAGGFVDG